MSEAMSEPQTPPSTDPATDNDAELAAIRNLMSTAEGAGETPAKAESESAAAPALRSMAQAAAFLPAVVTAKILPAPADAPEQVQPDHKPEVAEKQPSRTAELAGRMFRWAFAHVKAYRPERKRILITSLVLLLVLKPFFVIGWTAVFVMGVVLCFAVMGADAFWRKVIDLYQRFARRRPEHARVLKLRAYVVARKWDRLLRFLPAAMADQMRPPDLRDVIAADARHALAMQDRLQRLNKDDTVW